MGLVVHVTLGLGCPERPAHPPAATLTRPLERMDDALGIRRLGAPDVATSRRWAAADAACDGCHVDHARAHGASAHGRSFTNAVFQAEYAATRNAACVRCHAPLAAPDAPAATTDGAARGVGCLVCHDQHAVPSEPAPSPFVAPARLGCADCHDFPVEWLDARGAYAPGQRLQRTAAEHAASDEAEAGLGCVDCHAPRCPPGDGLNAVSDIRTRHDWPGARDPAMLARALEVDADAAAHDDAVEVEVRLRTRAGHAVPTGDVFRALVVVAEDADLRVDPSGVPRDAMVRLERRFEPTPDGLREVEDLRVPADGSTLHLRLRLPPDCRRVRLRIEWQALRPHTAHARGLAEADVRREVTRRILEVRDEDGRGAVGSAGQETAVAAP